jgi:hypothetical protein
VHLKAFIIVSLYCAFCSFATGCATTKKITADILGKGQTLRKKIAFLPAVNGPGYGGEDFQRAAAEQLKAFLSRRCDNLRIMDSRNIRKALEDISRLPSGQIDNLALAKLGRVFGLSAVLNQTIGQIECLTDKRGIWGFRRTCRLARLSLRARVYDIQTTAILLDEIIREDVEVSEYDWNNIKTANGYNEEIAHRLLAKMTAKTGKMICERLAEEPWKGYIITGSDNTFTISAGTDVGLVAGDVLEVFGLGEPMKGQDSHIYLVSGPKIGEIRVTQVKGDRAEAAGVLGYDLEQSSFVRLKR